MIGSACKSSRRGQKIDGCIHTCFLSGKKFDDDLFDTLNTTKVNTHLKGLMPGLTAKVFRTYNASYTLDKLVSTHKPWRCFLAMSPGVHALGRTLNVVSVRVVPCSSFRTPGRVLSVDLKRESCLESSRRNLQLSSEDLVAQSGSTSDC